MSPSRLDRGVFFALLSGVLLALSFPKFGHPSVAWIALTPLLVSLTGSTGVGRAFVLGLLTGLVSFVGTVYWLAHVMSVYGGLPLVVAAFLMLAFVAYLALFPALFAVVMARLISTRGASALMAAPVVWVATELGRTYIMTGFPWVLLGYSQATILPVAQAASLFGVYGVSALVAGVGAAAAAVAIGQSGVARWGPAAGMAGVMTLVVVWGAARVERSEWTGAGSPVTVGLIQGNVDQAQKYDPAHAGSIFQNYLQMSRQALDQGARFVLWPEASTPFRFGLDLAETAAVRTLAQGAGVPLLVGSDEAEPGEPTRYYNSAFLVGTDGATSGVYRKMHLVPWGEYVPWRRLLFFVSPLVETIGQFSPGDRAAVLPVDGHWISTAICYEIVYPNLVRQFVRGGSELLTTITNDAWFGATSAPYQHFAQASMRAIEQGRYLVRSANTGISGIVDPYGRVLARSEIYQPAVIVGDVRFLQGSTVYSRIGDVFAYACVVVSFALLVLTRRKTV